MKKLLILSSIFMATQIFAMDPNNMEKSHTQSKKADSSFNESYFTEAKSALNRIKSNLPKMEGRLPKMEGGYSNSLFMKRALPDIKIFDELWAKGTSQEIFLKTFPLNSKEDLKNFHTEEVGLASKYMNENENKDKNIRKYMDSLLKSKELSAPERKAIEDGFKNFKLSEVVESLSKLANEYDNEVYKNEAKTYKEPYTKEVQEMLDLRSKYLKEKFKTQSLIAEMFQGLFEEYPGDSLFEGKK